MTSAAVFRRLGYTCSMEFDRDMVALFVVRLRGSFIVSRRSASAAWKALDAMLAQQARQGAS